MAVNATAIWRVRPSGSNTNGGGYDAGIAGAGTDYSQQNSAQASGTHGTAAGTTDFQDTTAANFTSAMVGNALYITGTGLTTGWYFCTAYISATDITLDRSPGTGTTGTWHLGGGWADFWTNTTSSGPLVPGNTIYILGSGMPNPSSYTYDYSPSAHFTPAFGSDTAGLITYANDPSTPSGGYPCIKIGGGLFSSSNYLRISGLWIVASGTAYGGSDGIIAFSANSVALGVIIDGFGYDNILVSAYSSYVIGCELTSSVSKRATNAQPALLLNGAYCFGCNIHDNIGVGVSVSNNSDSVDFCLITKNGGDGVQINGTSAAGRKVTNSTIDANVGNGITIVTQLALVCMVYNNIISNHTTASTFGMAVDVGTAAQNNLIKGFVDYNTFYNNTTDLNAISYGAHDSHGGSNPYVNQSTNDYALNSGYYAAGTAPTAFPQNITGWNG